MPLPWQTASLYSRAYADAIAMRVFRSREGLAGSCQGHESSSWKHSAAGVAGCVPRLRGLVHIGTNHSQLLLSIPGFEPQDCSLDINSTRTQAWICLEE